MKTYHTRKSARMAIKKAGLSGMNVEYDTCHFGASIQIMPTVVCELREDYHEVHKRGFNARMVNELEDA